MSVSYKQRKKAISDAKRHYDDGKIPPQDFAMLQANWRREIDGPAVGSLADLVAARSAGA